MAFLDTLAQIAPGIATALGGPLAGIAVKGIEQALGVKPGSTDAQMEAALNGATPDQLLALKKADNDFLTQMKQLDINLEDLNVKDRQSAREREIATKDKIPAVLGGLCVTGFFGILGYMMVFGLSRDTAGSDAFLLLLGSLGAIVTQVFNYYFGSSSGSAKKDETIKKIAESP